MESREGGAAFEFGEDAAGGQMIFAANEGDAGFRASEGDKLGLGRELPGGAVKEDVGGA